MIMQMSGPMPGIEVQQRERPVVTGLGEEYANRSRAMNATTAHEDDCRKRAKTSQER